MSQSFNHLISYTLLRTQRQTSVWLETCCQSFNFSLNQEKLVILVDLHPRDARVIDEVGKSTVEEEMSHKIRLKIRFGSDRKLVTRSFNT